MGRWTSSVGAFSVLFLASAAGQASASDAMRGGTGAQGARWQDSVITLTFEPTMDAFGESAFESLIEGVTVWQSLPLPLPTMIVDRGGTHELGYRPKSANYNSVRYAIDGDPMARGALAITIITFDTDAKRILDADIVMNGEHRFDILTADLEVADNTYDLQNVLTHELGHLLGLGEDFEHQAATMYAYSLPREVGKRDLDEPDLAAIATLYDGVPEPPHNFAGCGGATVSRSAAGNQAWLWSFLGLGIAAGAARRRAWRSALLRGVGTLAVFCAIRFDSALVDSKSMSLDDSFAAGALAAALEVSPSATVLESRSHWEQGLVVTTLFLNAPLCRESTEHCNKTELEVLGGRVGSVEQIIGHASPPPVGSRVDVDAGPNRVGPWVKGQDGALLRLHVRHDPPASD